MNSNNFSYILERLSSRAKNALIMAQLASEELKHDHIGSEHLLYGVISEKSSFAAEILTKTKLTPEIIKQELILVNSNNTVASWKPVLSENLKSVIEKSAIIASQYGYQFIGTEHFLYGLLTVPQNKAKVILSKLGIDIFELEQNLISVFENISKFPEMPSEGSDIHPHAMPGEAGAQQPGSPIPRMQGKKEGLLEYFTTDITKKAKNGLVDPVIGRKKEIERLVSILNRRTKNNPILIGEAGVGKTAIVEGLALAIINRDVPDSLLDKKILSLDLALIVAGSMFRGEFENRLKQIIEEVKNNPNIILFIDELHTMVGAGATTGSLDAANILKPALARGELRAIGATTLNEYKQYIEKDAALERRFQPILVEEPTREESIEILKGLRPNYEKHHNVKITDEAIKASVDLSSRYLQDRFLPDKAVDLVDETSAFLRSIASSSKLLRATKKIENDLESLEQEKTKAVLAQDFTTAIHLKTQEEKLQKQKDQLSKSLMAEKSSSKHVISAEDIAHTVSMITKIPLAKLTKTEIGKLSNLEKTLKAKIVGQDEAVEEISKSIRRSRAGIANPNRPLGSFIFLGPTGVGKTETAKVLAAEVFEDADALVRVDMSEFMERHNVSRLVGAPAGYVGYGEGGHLTEAVRRKPYSVVLFDEIEKANPEIFNILLQILEDGQLTDAQGKKVSFKNTVVIMTSNLGMQELSLQAVKIGFADREEKEDKQDKLKKEYEEIKESILESMKQEFRPEFLNRLDKIIIFKPLGFKDLKLITQLQISDLQARLLEQNVQLKVTSAVVKYISEQSFDPAQGARYVRKNVQSLLEDSLAEKIISGKAKEGVFITADVKKGKINFSIKNRAKNPEIVPV
ncbi:MAG: ATP-dependent Clp protease ATP-binding subunit ClpC [Candidatus Doudnabacteria bacterium CG10_big_fil_rev_8_21_14_0_10_42_18]|uniref:ATP-dependent Clp protease ATP-binding subunit ClpC n=1 Tax=Candidatus Doudnabacteria bacterium CG10_big_fil_rev_8_21_14_0_10_42_18 TaxID=1974552 RepID=A0A2H0VBM3_9BACT|nr:MAG: ATP-dependent Clp protease ATP-binding subunit ClpC [Candidatus Doudnabacteria bacterium CG10_big_fil_rev_8_21_14_0_10_42_18]